MIRIVKKREVLRILTKTFSIRFANQDVYFINENMFENAGNPTKNYILLIFHAYAYILKLYQWGMVRIKSYLFSN